MTLAEQTIARSEQERVRALIAPDIPRLSLLLADDLTYTHSSGDTQSKQEFLAAVTSGQLRYRSMQHSDVRIRGYGSTGVLTGLSRVEVVAQGKALSLKLRFIAVYVHAHGRWQMVAWQSTKTT